LTYAPEHLRNDPDVVRTAVDHNRCAILFAADPELRADAAYERAGPVQTRLLLRHLPIPDEVVRAHILPHCQRA
jgi:hypothetical protein